MKLEHGGVFLPGDNKALYVQGVIMVIIKEFDDREFFLHNMRYVPEPVRNFLSIGMFGNLGYYTKVEYEMLEISYGREIIIKGSKICVFYIF